jgi:hypothetical protein
MMIKLFIPWSRISDTSENQPKSFDSVSDNQINISTLICSLESEVFSTRDMNTIRSEQSTTMISFQKVMVKSCQVLYPFLTL